MEAASKTKDVLIEELEHIYAQMAEVLLHTDTIAYQENPRIEAEYASKIGVLEVSLFQAQILARRAKRKLQMANSLLNRSLLNQPAKQIDDQLEAELDREFSAWIEQANQTMQDVLEKTAWLNGRAPLSDGERASIKKAYRLLMMRLHPDLRTERSELLDRFLEAAKHAYARGDLPALEALVSATDHLQSHDCTNLTPIELEAQLVVASEMLTDLQNRLDELMRSHPFNLKSKLSSKAWVSNQTRQLKEQIEEQQKAAALYQAKYEELMAAAYSNQTERARHSMNERESTQDEGRRER